MLVKHKEGEGRWKKIAKEMKVKEEEIELMWGELVRDIAIIEANGG